MLVLNSSESNNDDNRFFSSALSEAHAQLKEASTENLEKAFLHYCDVHIEEKEKGELREEEVGYNICGCLFTNEELIKTPHLEAIVDHACTMELPRESSVGCGIEIGDTWTDELAARFKAKEWNKFTNLVEFAKTQLSKQ